MFLECLCGKIADGEFIVDGRRLKPHPPMFRSLNGTHDCRQSLGILPRDSTPFLRKSSTLSMIFFVQRYLSKDLKAGKALWIELEIP
jgi:hypothetical protein